MNKQQVAAVVAPIGMVLVPKCPLCLLPILAAIGVAVPPGWILDAAVGTVAIAWLVLLLRLSHSHMAKWIGVVAALLLVAGRLTQLAVAASIGAAMMIAVAVAVLRLRDCAVRSCAR